MSQYHLRHRTRENNDNDGEEASHSTTASASMLSEELTTTTEGSAANNPSTADLMKAIVTLQQTVDTRLTTISATMNSMQASLSTVSGKVREIEEAVSRHDDQLVAQEAICKTLQEGYNEMRKKLLQAEFRSRRQNIRVAGVCEGVEGNNASEFVSSLIPKLLGAEHFPAKVLVDIAHRVGPKSDTGNYTRAIIAKIHYLQEKTLITRLAAQKSPLQYNGARVSIFPDQPTEVYQQRKKFQDVRKRCRDAGIQSGFVGTSQIRLRVTIDGATRYFDGPEAAGRFLDGRPVAVSGDVDDDDTDGVAG